MDLLLCKIDRQVSESSAMVPPPHQTGNRWLTQVSGRKVRAPQNTVPVNDRGVRGNRESMESATENEPLPFYTPRG